MALTSVGLTPTQKTTAVNDSNAAERINTIFASLILNTDNTFTEVQSSLDIINTLLNSDDTTLDELQEVVNFIKANKADLDSLGIANIAGLETALNGKQSTLVSGTNIKTVNGNSLLGTGNLTLSSSWGSITGTLSNQTDLQNALNAKQNTLISSSNIKTIGGINILGSGDLVLSADGLGTSTQWGLV